MQGQEIRKVVTVGLALAGLGFVGVGAAYADSTPDPAVSTTLADDDWYDDWFDDDWFGDWYDD